MAARPTGVVAGGTAAWNELELSRRRVQVAAGGAPAEPVGA
jgi:hypothetical protein